MVDGTFIKVHPHGTGISKMAGRPDPAREALGRRRDGLTNILVAMTDK